jgi:hypothetical protein
MSGRVQCRGAENEETAQRGRAIAAIVVQEKITCHFARLIWLIVSRGCNGSPIIDSAAKFVEKIGDLIGGFC